MKNKKQKSAEGAFSFWINFRLFLFCKEKKAIAGQVIMLDLFLAALVFLLLASMLFAEFGKIDSKILTEQTLNQMNFAALNASDSLVNGAGIPSNWINDVNNASAIGLKEKKQNLSEKKWNALKQLNYTTLKELLGIKGFEIRIELLDLKNNFVDGLGLKQDNLNEAVAIERIIKLNGIERRLHVYVWKR